MGKIILNTALTSLRGRVDGWVYRRRAGQTLVAKLPDFSQVVASAGQLVLHERFLRALEYGKAVNGDPARREPYELAAQGTLSSPFSIAVGDAMGLPVVKEVDITAYAGHPGNVVKVDARDDFEVVGVKLTVRDATSGAVVEQGQAVKSGGFWVYTAQTEAPRDRDLEIEAEASDRPGNQRTLSEMWHG